MFFPPIPVPPNFTVLSDPNRVLMDSICAARRNYEISHYSAFAYMEGCWRPRINTLSGFLGYHESASD